MTDDLELNLSDEFSIARGSYARIVLPAPAISESAGKPKLRFMS